MLLADAWRQAGCPLACLVVAVVARRSVQALFRLLLRPLLAHSLLADTVLVVTRPTSPAGRRLAMATRQLPKLPSCSSSLVYLYTLNCTVERALFARPLSRYDHARPC